MSLIPATETLGVRRRIEGDPDAHGNPTIDYAEPVDWPVWGVAPGAMEELHDPNRDLSLILWTVYAPQNAALPGELDRVVYRGVEYDAEARARDWTRGPWRNPSAGAVVELRKPEG